MNRRKRIHMFVNTMWEWYVIHKRTLPWRDLPDTDPAQRAYKILVSEIMLQQTQVPRVMIKYKEFLERFPTIGDLAGASNRDVLIAWRGMGYNSRALRLRDAARSIVKNDELRMTNYENFEFRISKFIFPCEMEDLTSIKGIGTYTAAAIRNFAFGIPTPCVDTNIRRILHRTFVGPENPDGTWEKDDAYLIGIARGVLADAIGDRGLRSLRGERGGRREQRGRGDLEESATSSTSETSFTSLTSAWHAALMDYGSLVQTKRSPKWNLCPLTRRGIMKTTKRNFEFRIANCEKGIRNSKFLPVRQAGAIPARPAGGRNSTSEPGRLVGSTFIPNRIFRGRVIDALRDAPRGLTLHAIGRRVAIDWDPREHRAWLRAILAELTREAMLGVRGRKYVLG